ncbi:hypothetical protein [Mangrovibacterium lignilyticum]|uniref:hypothetical protein n=1 Tax=Mangrovibacterium lignilyticum TaxID=2668052 RepID=UPI0013D6C587|nr:hypothetical protein [Mangrovibacterium lignilyticum]
MNKHFIPVHILATLLGLVLMYPSTGMAQNNTRSPYSMYGLGELRSQLNPVNTGMGGAGFGLSSKTFINTLNPASYQGIDSLSFVFDTGIEGKYTTFKSQGKSASLQDANFSYLALGWRINSFIAAGFGLNPFSSAGYEINTTAEVEGTQSEYPLNIIGSGDISRAYGAISIAPIPNLSIGIKTSFLFGSLKQTQYHNLSVIGSTSVYNETTDYFHNFYFEFGAQYALKIQKYSVTIGAIYNPGQALVTKRDQTSYNSSGVVFDSSSDSQKDFKIPEEIGVGFVVDNNKNLLYALDAGMQKWSDYSYDLSGVKLKNNPYIRTGLQFTPSTNFLASFFSKVNYRLGFNYSKSYLDLRGIQLEEVAGSFGLGLPIRNGKSKIDVSFEAGTKGTTSKRLIQENFVRLRVGFSMHDLWFQQRKFN